MAVIETAKIDSGRLCAADNLRHLADSLNDELERTTDRDQRSGIGQFTTSADVARTIASLVEPTGRPLKVVDAGAGTGALMLALTADFIERGIEVPIEVDLVETDTTAINLLQKAASEAFRRAILFDRRDRLFRSSSVLQETIIFSLKMTTATDSASVQVETRSDHLSKPHQLHDVLHDHIVSPEDSQMFINLPASPAETHVSSQVAALPADLTSLCLSVSTGPVVDFRSREYLTEAGVSGSVPLIYPANIKTTGVEWPVATAKPQGFAVADTNRRMLFPNGPYVLTKRFTSKEQRRRVVAGVYLPVEGYDHVAFENHVNVVHRNREPINESEAVQLAEFLNSELVDTYFRMFSGSTQVNASDLRRMRFPQLDDTDSSHGTHTQGRLSFADTTDGFR